VKANCPQCSATLTVDDAKVPNRPFALKCPKCQAVVRLPGRPAAAAPAAAPAAPGGEPLPSPLPEPAPALSEEALRADILAQLRREMFPQATAQSGRAVVALVDKGQAANLTLALTRAGYNVDSVSDSQELGRLVEQSHYAVVATSLAAAPKQKESFYQRINRLSSEARRNVFVMLVGPDLKTGDPHQAFIALVDLVVNPNDLTTVDDIMRQTMADRARLYQVFNESREREEMRRG
jgi:predicted Zn finger-like uncharacterized protein